jgi:phospholipid transport system substrate-binding protein
MLNRLFVVLLLVWSSTNAFASETVERAIRSATAEQAVELATGEVLALISAGKTYAKDEPERFYNEVEALLRPLIDFPRFARNVMGPYFRSASAEQRDRFAESFKWSLVRTYALALTEFGDGEVSVLPPRQPPKDPDKVNVTQEIKYEGKVYQVVYRMRRGNEQTWSIQNLIVEGINIGLNYKSQFSAAMKDPQYGGDMDAVIEAWVDMVEAEAKSEEDSSASPDAPSQTPAG